MTRESPEARPRVFSIGHSNHPLDAFIGLLRQHGIEVLVDVRSRPYSRYVPHFNRDALKSAVTASGMTYVYLGRELGGRPGEPEYYDPDGHVLYSRVAESALFLQGIRRIEKGAKQYRIAMMCSEEDPSECHRHLLIGRVLAGRGMLVDHIRGDGRIQSEVEIAQDRSGRDAQLPLFEEQGETAWRSTRSVSPGRPRNSSSERSSELA